MVRGFLIAMASLAVEHWFQGAQASVVVAPRLYSTGSTVVLLCSMWDLPESGIESVSFALAGGFFTSLGKLLLQLYYVSTFSPLVPQIKELLDCAYVCIGTHIYPGTHNTVSHPCL